MRTAQEEHEQAVNSRRLFDDNKNRADPQRVKEERAACGWRGADPQRVREERTTAGQGGPTAGER